MAKIVMQNAALHTMHNSHVPRAWTGGIHKWGTQDTVTCIASPRGILQVKVVKFAMAKWQILQFVVNFYNQFCNEA
jgi:hypothetical protein